MDRQKLVDLKEWAEITVQRWEMRISKLRFLPGHTSALINSFRAHVEKDAGGDNGKIAFTFLFYGYYVDAGAGPGSRAPKKWFNKIYWREFNQLSRLLAAQYGDEAVDGFMKSIERINYHGQEHTGS
ncbi:MAG: hypothetical protein Q4F69_02585 [Bacteroidia bacterium]|nr:hypothetical protein [Bacteroidia bacterium]